LRPRYPRTDHRPGRSHPDRAEPGHRRLPRISLRCTNWVAAHWTGHQSKMIRSRALTDLSQVTAAARDRPY